MSRSDKQELESELFDDVEGLLKDYFQNNVPDQETNPAFLKASLTFLYRQLEKRLENLGSETSCEKSSSRTESSTFSCRQQGDPSQYLPPLGYQEKVRYWASKYLHAGRNVSRSSSSCATSKGNLQPKIKSSSRAKLSDSNAVTHCGVISKGRHLCTSSFKPNTTGDSRTSTSIASTDDKVLIIVSEQTEGVHECESRVSSAGPKPSKLSAKDYKKGVHKSEYDDSMPAGKVMKRSICNGQNCTEKEENVLPDKYFKFLTQSLEVTAQKCIEIDNEVNNNDIFKCGASTVSGTESTRMYKDPSPSESEFPQRIKDEGFYFQVSPNNHISSHDIATARAQDEIRSNASSTKETKKSKSPSSRIHAAILNLFGAKNTEKKNGSKSGSKSSKTSMGVNANNEDTITTIRRVLSNKLSKLSVHSAGQTMPSDRQNVNHKIREYQSSLSGKDTSFYGDRESRLEKLKKLKVCRIPFVPACQSCDQIYTFVSSGSATRDVATCTEEQITRYSECKRCFSCNHCLEPTLPRRSESIFSEMHYKFSHHAGLEELSNIFLYALLNDLRKHNKYTSSKINSKSKRTSRFPDVRSYGVTSWPLSITRHCGHRTKTQPFYEKCKVNSGHKEKPRLPRQPSKFSAWNGDEKYSDSDEEYPLKRHRLLPEHLAELANLMPGRKLRSTVKSSLVIKSSHGSEHIPTSKS